MDSWASLKTSIIDWLNKVGLTDADSKAAQFITLFEASANRNLNTREMVATMTLTLSDEEISLPCDFGGVRSFRLEGCNELLEYVVPDALDDAFGVGRPTRYTITDRIVLNPAPDSDYEARLRYRKRIPSLSRTCTTNWLLKKHPDAYLYGALTQALIYFRDDERSVIRDAYATALAEIEQDDKRTAQPSTLNAKARRF